MRISINDEKKKSEPYNTQGVTEGEVDGPGGADLSGGDVTPPQDAAAANSEINRERIGDEKMEEDQQAGEVGKQRQHQHPSANDPEHGMPSPPLNGDTADTEGGANDEEDAKKNSESSELEETKAQLLRVAADFENFRRQSQRREAEVRERAVRGVLEDLLPVLDNFERAVGAADSTSDVQSLKMGVDYILQQFSEALKAHGIEPIEAEGKLFNPAEHDAIEEVESDAEAGTVVDDVQRGYIFKGNVLRPSRVKVAK